MNNKIPLRVLAQQMAQSGGLSENECQEFVKALFRNVSEDLYRGQSIVIDGIGSFSVNTSFEDPVQFEADAELAAELNAPFSFFRPMALSETLDPEDAEKLNDITVELVHEQNEAETAAIDNDVNIADASAEDSESVVNNSIDTPEHNADDTDNDFSVSGSETDIHEITPPAIPVIGSMSKESVINSSSEVENTPELESVGQNVECKDTQIITEDINPTSAQSDVDTMLAVTQEIFIPEEEEEYVEYHTRRSGSRFWLGFIIGLLAGLVLAAVALAIYVVQFLNYPLSNLG